MHLRSRHILPTLTALLWLCATMHATAQMSPIWLGPGGGFGLGRQSASMPVYSGSTACGVFETGSHTELWAGARAMAPRVFSESLGLSLSLSWSSTNGALVTTPVDRQLAIDPLGSGWVELEREYRLEHSASSVRLDLTATVLVAERWRLSAGPSIGSNLSLSSTRVDTLLGPGRISFAGGARSRPITLAPDLRSNRLALGATLAVGYQMPAGARTTLLPEVSLRWTPTSIEEEGSWRQVTMGLGLSLLFDMSPSDTVVPPPAPRAPLLTASVEVEGVEESGQVVTVAEVLVNELLVRGYTPLVPAIFFDEGSSTISDRYMTAVTHPKRSFTPDSAAGRSPVDLHRYTLDIVGHRMQLDTSARLALHGSVSSGEPQSLAALRAESVRRYLTTTWGITVDRISIEESDGPMKRSSDASEDGRVENRRVELSSNRPGILSPVVSEEVTREFTPPMIRMTPSISAEAGVKVWTMEITQGGMLVARYRSTDTTEDEVEWKIDGERIDSIPSPIAVELTVEDSAGAIVHARDEIPVRAERRVETIDGRGDDRTDRTIYSLVSFDYDVAEPAASDVELLEEIVGRLRSGSRVTVIGFTDRTGDDQHNRELSRRRAERVASMLRDRSAQRNASPASITTEAGGVDTRRFTNDRPEGRILSRGVQVIVEW